MEPVNGASDIATVAESVDEFGGEEVGEFVGAAEEGVGGGEKGVGKQDVGDGGVTGARVGVVVGVGLRVGGPVEEEESMVGVVCVLDHLGNQAWSEVA